MPLEGLDTPCLGIDELRPQSFDLMQNFLAGGIESARQRRVHTAQHGSECVQLGGHGVSNPVEDFHSLDAGYRFALENIASPEDIDELDIVFLEGAGDPALHNRGADPWKDRWNRTVERFVHGARLSKISDLGGSSDICGRGEYRILHC